MPIYKGGVPRLPAEYQEVEYIESTGEQWINTGYVATTNNLNVKTKIYTDSMPSLDYYIVGNANSGLEGFACSLYQQRVTVSLPTANLTSNEFSGSQTLDIEVNINSTENIIYLNVNGQTYTSSNWRNFVTSATFRIFRIPLLTNRNFSGKLYSCSIYDNDIIQRNFVPCYRKSDNEIGLYDLVNNVFYTNQGTGTFLKGADVKSVKKVIGLYKGSTQIIKRYKGTHLIYSYSRLPKEYQEVEYLESTGTQYIDTNFILKNNSSINIKYQFTEDINGKRARCWGATDKMEFNGSKMYAYCGTSNLVDNALFGYGSENVRSDSGVIYPAGTSLHIVKQNKNELYLDGVLIKTYSSQEFISYGNAYLFQVNNPSGVVDNNASMRIFYAKISDNDTLVRDFVPCYIKATGKAGLYDLVTKQFFANQGTGDFLYPSHTPEEYQRVEYIESSGTQYIDTGIVVSNLGINGAFEVEFKPTNLNSFCIFGSWYQDNTMAFQLGYRDANEITMSYGYDNYEYITYSVDKTKFNKLYNSNGLQKLNDIVIGNKITQTTILQNNSNMLLFARTNNQQGIDKYGAVLKSASIYLNNTLIRNFIPCYRKSDNVIGLYDMVTKTFFTNAGTGTFIKGPDV